MSLIELLKSRKIIPLMKRKIAKLGETRYVIYLPTELNELWREIHDNKRKINVYIEMEMSD